MGGGGVARDPFELAVGALNSKERTIAELSDWLAQRDVEPAEVEETVARLVELGELDDARFAHRYAEDKRELRGWGAERIREALLGRGIDSHLVEAAVGAETHGDQVERAVGLLARRAEPLEHERDRARALAYLARRGYDSDAAYEAIRRRGRIAS